MLASFAANYLFPGIFMSTHLSKGQPSDTSLLRGLLTLLRPCQWVKNGFVLAPLIFSGSFLETDALTNAALAFLLFCVGSSATYIINDIHDIELDRKHPNKSKKRPLATGVVKVPQALFLVFMLYVVLVWGYFMLPGAVLVIVAYLVLNIAYTYFLQHQPVIDIFTIAIGFVLRVYAGAIALSVPVSSWMFVTTLCLALYLAAVKRRQEMSLSGVTGRRVLAYYSIQLVDRYAEIAAIGALVFYSLYVMSVRPEMVIAIPFVVFGLFRYWFVVESLDGGESPTDVLFNDWQLVLTVVIWIGVSMWAIWPEGG